MKTPLAALLFAAAIPAWSAYQYYYSDSFTSIDRTKWVQNGALVLNNGIANTDGIGGSLISRIAVPNGSADY